MNRFETTTKFAPKVGFDRTIKCLSKICPFTVDPKTFIVTSGPIYSSCCVICMELTFWRMLNYLFKLHKRKQGSLKKHLIFKWRSWRSRITRTNSYKTNAHPQHAMSINWLLGLKWRKIVFLFYPFLLTEKGNIWPFENVEWKF